MLYHLKSQFFVDATLKSLVYTAPFVAPLAFTGLGLLLIMNGMIADTEQQWGQWVVFLAGCGWCGNFILSAFDHAQNGFFYPLEWLPVFTSALAVGCWAVLLLVSYPPGFLTFSLAVFVINFIVGVAGFGFHLAADFKRPAVALIDGLLYGAPVFAPLLFPNLALLMCLGISKLSVATSKTPQNRQ